MVITQEFLDKHRTAKGGFTAAQLKTLEIDWPPPKNWLRGVIGRQIGEEQAAKFAIAASKKRTRVKPSSAKGAS